MPPRHSSLNKRSGRRRGRRASSRKRTSRALRQNSNTQDGFDVHHGLSPAVTSETCIPFAALGSGLSVPRNSIKPNRSVFTFSSFSQIDFADTKGPYPGTETPGPDVPRVDDLPATETRRGITRFDTPVLPPLEFSCFECDKWSLSGSATGDNRSILSPLLYHTNPLDVGSDEEKAFLLNHGQDLPDPDFKSYKALPQEQLTPETAARTLHDTDTPLSHPPAQSNLSRPLQIGSSGEPHTNWLEENRRKHKRTVTRFNDAWATSDGALNALSSPRVFPRLLSPMKYVHLQAQPSTFRNLFVPIHVDVHELPIRGTKHPYPGHSPAEKIDLPEEQTSRALSPTITRIIDCGFEEIVTDDLQDVSGKERCDDVDDWEWVEP